MTIAVKKPKRRKKLTKQIVVRLGTDLLESIDVERLRMRKGRPGSKLPSRGEVVRILVTCGLNALDEEGS